MLWNNLMSSHDQHTTNNWLRLLQKKVNVVAIHFLKKASLLTIYQGQKKYEWYKKKNSVRANKILLILLILFY